MGTYLIGYYGTAGCSSVGGDDNAAIEDAADDCSSSAGSFGERDAFGVEGGVPVVVGEVEAGHGGGRGVRAGVFVVECLEYFGTDERVRVPKLRFTGPAC